jgi:hypothetical protein
MWHLALAWAVAAEAGEPGEVERASPEAALVCPPQPAAAVTQAARAAQASWLALDTAAFALARHQVTALLPCVERAMTVDEAVAVHVASGLIAFSDEDVEATRRSFAAVHALQPGWTLPGDALPPEHPLAQLIAGSVAWAGRPGLPIAVTPVHGWAVDGVRFPRPEDPRREATYTLPSQRAFVLQVFGERGEVVYTGHHLSTVDVPVSAIVVANDADLVHRKRAQVARGVGSAVGSGLLAGAAVALGVGLAARDAIADAPAEDVDQLVTRANVLGGTAAGLGVAGAALWTIAWTVRW